MGPGTMQPAAIAGITSPAEFEREVEKRWRAAEKHKDLVSSQVSDDELDPQDGLALIACVTGTLFGYQQFHGNPSPVDLAAALNPATRR